MTVRPLLDAGPICTAVTPENFIAFAQYWQYIGLSAFFLSLSAQLIPPVDQHSIQTAQGHAKGVQRVIYFLQDRLSPTQCLLIGVTILVLCLLMSWNIPQYLRIYGAAAAEIA